MTLLVIFNAIGVGAATITEANDSISAAATVALTGSSTITEADDGISAAAAVALAATLSKTDDDDTVYARGRRDVRKILRNVTTGGSL